MTITCKIETITPEIAKSMIEITGDRNFRKSGESHISPIAKDMKDGIFEINGETIKVGKDGCVLDGLHRLKACVKSGVEFKTFVVRGLNGVHETIDGGQPRSLSQWLAYRGFKNATACSGIVTGVCDYNAGLWWRIGIGKSEQKSMQMIVRWAIENKHRIEDTSTLSMSTGPLLASSISGTIMFLGVPIDKLPSESEFAKYFSSGIKSGSGLGENDPIFVLRERLVKDKLQSSVKFTKHTKKALATIAWNKMCAGQEVKILKWNAVGPSAETFPKIEQSPES